MRATGNDLLKEKNALKDHNLVLADIVTNLNGYITQLRVSAPSGNHAHNQPVITTSLREQKIPDPPLFAGDRSKARAWIMDMRLKLAADAQLFRNEQVKMIYANSCLEGTVKATRPLKTISPSALPMLTLCSHFLYSSMTTLSDDEALLALLETCTNATNHSLNLCQSLPDS